jgi:integrase
MANRKRNFGINIRVTPEEKEKIERNARKCRLSVSEYLRQIAMKKQPKELPSEEMIQSLMRLRNVISDVTIQRQLGHKDLRTTQEHYLFDLSRDDERYELISQAMA